MGTLAPEGGELVVRYSDLLERSRPPAVLDLPDQAHFTSFHRNTWPSDGGASAERT